MRTWLAGASFELGPGPCLLIVTLDSGLPLWISFPNDTSIH